MRLFFQILCFLIPVISSAWNDCPSSDLIFTSEYDIQNFRDQYPDCTRLMGNVTLLWLNGETALDGFSNIDTIDGNLSILSTSLTKIVFPQLKFVGGDLNMNGNQSLMAVHMRKLSSIEGCLFIRHNDVLAKLAFISLMAVRHSMDISYNHALTDFKMNKLGRVGGMRISYNQNLESYSLPNLRKCLGLIDLISNPSLNEIKWANLEIIPYHIFIYDNGGLELLTFPKLRILRSASIHRNHSLKVLHLNNLEQVYSWVSITENATLHDLFISKDLERIGHDFIIAQNESLSDCRTLCHILSDDIVLGGIYIYGNALGCDSRLSVEKKCMEAGYHYMKSDGVCPEKDVILTTQVEVDSFTTRYPNCTKINGSLFIWGPDISSLGSVVNITEVANDFTMSSTNLINYQAEIASVGGRLLMNGNTNIESLDLPSLEVVEGSALFIENDSLRSLQTPVLDTVGESLGISDHVSLEFVELPALRSVEQINIARNRKVESIEANFITTLSGFAIVENQQLVDAEFSALHTISSYGFVDKNPILRDLNLSQLRYVGSSFSVSQNDSLADCKTFCNYIALNGFDRLRIGINAPGCSLRQDLIERCGSYCFDSLVLPFFIFDNYQVSGNLSTTGTIFNLRTLNLSSGESVILEPRFEVRPGSELNINIKGCQN